MTTWLIIDGNYLSCRAFYTTGHLTNESESTGMAYGFLREVNALQDRFDTDKIAFCFDYFGLGKRSELSSVYKNKRKKHTDDEVESHLNFRHQLKQLRTKHLPDLGYRNIFKQIGYEADDIIAAMVNNFDYEYNYVVIVSADKDLWQLLRPNVVCYDPRSKKVTNLDSFLKEWRIYPSEWPHVLAIAGCTTDNVIGLPGVGPKTAARWVAGTLKESSMAHKKISKGLQTIANNMPLVKLPFPGTVIPKLRDDEVTEDKWKKVMDELGFKTVRYRR